MSPVVAEVGGLYVVYLAPHCSEYGGCGSGMTEWLGAILFIAFFGLMVRASYRDNGIAGVIPIALWLIGMPLSTYLATLGVLPIWSILVVFTGMWWFDPVARKLGPRGDDFKS
mgnify:CR=1 FL=1